ncbi:MAG: hypothetical protein RMJ17_02260, partial [Candidatus Aenigmarchaeota archaeon]|nr:hypothetical protein [Candidatus Aenigmarchaeota archaeon]MDW8149396.1 hypothetical protein [Candidatus Aenigmarchaeota archaeon]
MKQKGISTVVATVMMLVIAIALVGSAYVFISAIFTARTATVFSIIDANYGNITIRNEGTANISSIRAVIDGRPVNVLFLDGPIQPGTVGTITLQYLPTTKGEYN